MDDFSRRCALVPHNAILGLTDDEFFFEALVCLGAEPVSIVNNLGEVVTSDTPLPAVLVKSQ